MILSDDERRHVEMMAATIAAGLHASREFEYAEVSVFALSAALRIRERVRGAYDINQPIIPQEPRP